jgi:hypothetical protein
MPASFLFPVVNVFYTASFVCSFLDSISIDSIVPWFHPSILSFLILLKKEKTPDRPIDTSLFFTAKPMPWIDATRPPHRTAMHWQYLRMISL